MGSVAALAGLAGVAAAKPEHIERVGSMRTPRAAHTATALPSGQVLVVGGMAGGGSLATAELMAASGASTATGSLAERRSGHTATRLPDGRVLVAGGYNGGYLRSVELYDPRTRRFAPAPPLREGRSGHTATVLADGSILFVGGVGAGWTFLASAERYDPATGRSTAVGSLATARESHTATLLRDGRVLVTGGHRGRRQDMVVHAGAELFSPRTGRFTAAGTLGTARHKHDAVLLGDGRVLVLGGADRTDRNHFATTELYDPAAGVFVPGPSMSHRRYKIAGTAVRLAGGAVLVPAGAEAAEVLDPASMRFHEVPGRFPAAFRFAATTPLADGGALITGGYADGNQTTSGIWRYRRP